MQRLLPWSLAFNALNSSAVAEPVPLSAAAAGPVILTDAEMDMISGGIGLLLPAVQSAREATRREVPASITASEALGNQNSPVIIVI
jgi:hypothetical protein